MARKRASMREGPLAELFKATEAAQRQAEQQQEAPGAEKHEEPQEATVEHVPAWEDEVEAPAPPPPPRYEAPVRAPEPEAAAPAYEPPHAPEPEPEPVREREPEPPPVSRYIEPMLEPAPRLHRVPRAHSASYLAVVRVLGVAGG